MKYIKLFESLEDGYVKKGSIEFNMIEESKFTEAEIKKLTGMGFEKEQYNRVLYSKNIYPSKNIHYKIYIVKGSDEWFYVNYYNVHKLKIGERRTDDYYECDQFDGLLNCLEKEFNMK